MKCFCGRHRCCYCVKVVLNYCVPAGYVALSLWLLSKYQRELSAFQIVFGSIQCLSSSAALHFSLRRRDCNRRVRGGGGGDGPDFLLAIPGERLDWSLVCVVTCFGVKLCASSVNSVWFWVRTCRVNPEASLTALGYTVALYWTTVTAGQFVGVMRSLRRLRQRLGGVLAAGLLRRSSLPPPTRGLRDTEGELDVLQALCLDLQRLQREVQSQCSVPSFLLTFQLTFNTVALSGFLIDSQCEHFSLSFRATLFLDLLTFILLFVMLCESSDSANRLKCSLEDQLSRCLLLHCLAPSSSPSHQVSSPMTRGRLRELRHSFSRLDFSLNALGMISINRKLLLSVSGICITYCVVEYQLIRCQ